MRLLHSRTMEFKEFFANIPKYATLSHTWADDEVTFQDMNNRLVAKKKAGYAKISRCCEKAIEWDLDWVWVDTCCIDKSSSAELSEAINSMYQWYKASTICFAYLEDVKADYLSQIEALASSRWFTRGWTLQELIAPKDLIFYDSSWKSIGTKRRLCMYLSTITRIDVPTLKGRDPRKVSIARRMSWASRRRTTRVEDIAYCLMGIFDVNMPLLYGEGVKAFTRLQEEIMKSSDDQSLFAWTAPMKNKNAGRSLLAESPAEFENSGNIVPLASTSERHYSMTNMGLCITLDLWQPEGRAVYTAILACGEEHPDPARSTLMTIDLKCTTREELFVRVYSWDLGRLPINRKHPETLSRTVYVKKEMVSADFYNLDWKGGRFGSGFHIRGLPEEYQCQVSDTFPPASYDQTNMVVSKLDDKKSSKTALLFNGKHLPFIVVLGLAPNEQCWCDIRPGSMDVDLEKFTRDYRQCRNRSHMKLGGMLFEVWLRPEVYLDQSMTAVDITIAPEY